MAEPEEKPLELTTIPKETLVAERIRLLQEHTHWVREGELARSRLELSRENCARIAGAISLINKYAPPDPVIPDPA